MLSAAEAKAQATGDPLIKERIELENEVARLRLSLGNYNNEHYQMQDQLERILPGRIAELDERIIAMRNDIAYLEVQGLPEGETFKMMVGDKAFNERAAAGEELMKAALRNLREERFVEIAEYAGFKICSRPHGFSTEFDLKIQRASSTTIESGDSPSGVIIRIKNAIQKLPENLVHLEEKKTSLEADLDRIRTQIDQPFEKAAELVERTEVKGTEAEVGMREVKPGGRKRKHRQVQQERNSLRR